MRRLHGFKLAPREGLPHGLLLLSLYAPLREQEEARASFDLALLEVVHTLDMQVPTHLQGDFNGTVCPARDYLGASAARLPVCPLLM